MEGNHPRTLNVEMQGKERQWSGTQLRAVALEDERLWAALLKASMKGEKLSLEWECGCWDRHQFCLGSSKILAVNFHHSQATDTGLVLTPKEPAWLTVYRDPQQGEDTSSPRKHQQMCEPGSVVHAAGALSHRTRSLTL